jgi:tetratricopeptide (TPR) repeat protein
VLATLPQDSILLTRNPVAVAVAADGLRPDLDVVDVDEPSTLTAFRSGQLLLPLGQAPPAGRIDPETLRSLVAASEGVRGVFVDPSIYFDAARRNELLQSDRIAVPHGLAFRLAAVGWKPTAEDRKAAALAWDGLNVTPGTPPSPLRDGLGGSAYFARSLVQSAYLHLEQGRAEDAEREFLLALGHPAANANLASLGYARLLHTRRNWREVVRTLESRTRDDEDGAWISRRLEGSTYLQLGDSDRAVAMLQRALRLMPAELTAERAKLQRSIREIQAKRRSGAASPGGP